MKKFIVILSLVLTFSGLVAQSAPKRINLDSFYTYEHDASLPLFVSLDSNLETSLPQHTGLLKVRLTFDSIPNYMAWEETQRGLTAKYKILNQRNVSEFVTEYLVLTEFGKTIYTVAIDTDKSRIVQVYCHFIKEKGKVAGWQSVAKF